MADVPAGWLDAVQRFVDEFPRTLDEVETLLSNNNLWIGRNRDVGVISGADAVSWGLTGPNLRASGVDYDVRKDRPYYDYETYDFDVPVGRHGDCYDRYLCRMEEMRQSLSIMQQALDRMPGGPINVDDPRVILPSKTDAMNDMESMIHHFKVVMEGVRAPAGECWYGVESSKGELGMYVVSDGGSKPVRWRVRGPSFINLGALPKLCEGHLLSDVIAINASIDIVLGEIDR
jgi:NADH-quinone oxidoreductase subunit D